MTKTEYILIGVMSGTSLDGLDLAEVKFSWRNNRWEFDLLEGRTVPFPNVIYDSLRNCMNLSGLELVVLDKDLGQFIGDEVAKFDLGKVDAVASHGHTIFHEPKKGFTHQIGSINEIHAITSLPVIGDFRSLDVSLKGEGAPLVPMGDKVLFSNYDATLNFGGISNITILGDQIRAFDLSPLNQVSNFICQKYFDCEYDKGGEIGKTGQVNTVLLNYFEEFTYYKIKGSKSLGREDVDQYFISEIEKSNLKPHDILRTYYEHIAIRISAELIENALKRTLCAGGGVFNEFLIQLISERIKSREYELIIPSKDIIDFKEAIIFAFLGLLRGLKQNNILKNVTGAMRDNMGGMLIGKNPF